MDGDRKPSGLARHSGTNPQPVAVRHIPDSAVSSACGPLSGPNGHETRRPLAPPASTFASSAAVRSRSGESCLGALEALLLPLCAVAHSAGAADAVRAAPEGGSNFPKDLGELPEHPFVGCGGGGAGGNRTLVRQVVIDRATTIPVSWLYGCHPPGRVGHEGPCRRVFPRCQRSFTPSAVSPCRPPPLLLPGCSGLAPRAVAGRYVSRLPEWIRRRERGRQCRPLFGCPV